MGYKKLNGFAKKPLKPMPDDVLCRVGHYIDHELVENVEHDCAKRIERIETGAPIRFLMTVGGAGAGGDLYLAMTRHLLPYVKAGKAELWINFGDHLTMWDVFKKNLPELEKECKTYFDRYADLSAWAETLDGKSEGGVTVFCNSNIFEMRHIGGHEVYGAIYAREIGDSTFECETAPALCDMIDTLINDKAILKSLCKRIVELKGFGTYNGGYEVVRLAIEGKRIV